MRPQQFVLLVFSSIHWTDVRELGPLPLQLALSDVLVAFEFECGQSFWFLPSTGSRSWNPLLILPFGMKLLYGV